MTLNLSSLQSLRRVFRHSFSAHDITEPLISVDQSAEAPQTSQFMQDRKLDVVGVRADGLVVGYLQRSSLGDGMCSQYVQRFQSDQVIVDTTPIAELILRLDEFPRLFVSVFGRVGGILTRSDIQKPAVRMWLFGMITLVEMRFTRIIEQWAVNGDWKQYVSEGRLQKAENLLAERIRRNQDLGLLDCLQFSDKCQIIARNEQLRQMTRVESRRKMEAVAKKVERLRNDLAHAQDIIATNWDSLVELAENLDDILEGPKGMQDS